MGARMLVFGSCPHVKGVVSWVVGHVPLLGKHNPFCLSWPSSEGLHMQSDLTLFNPFGINIRRQMCQEAYLACIDLICIDGKAVPSHQHNWRIGSSYSWHYVKIVEYRVNQLSQACEDMIMPKPTAKKGKSNDFQGYEFVRCELNPEDKKSAKIWIEENTAVFGSLLHDVVASDYKYTLSFSSEHDTFTACLVGKEDNAINPRKTLTARHKDWIMASLTVVYKHAVIFKGGIWEQPLDNADDGWA